MGVTNVMSTSDATVWDYVEV